MKHTLFMIVAYTLVLSASLTYSAAAVTRTSLADLEAAIQGLETRVGTLESENQAVTDRNQALEDRFACVSSASDAADFVFKSCNVHVQNGVGTTNSINGYGNLIIGYDAVRLNDSDKTGSHNRPLELHISAI